MPPKYLVTHSGGFHADELLSSAVLTRLYPQAKVMRTRDEAWTSPAPDRIVYDVGRDYDPAKGIFDHHQRDAPLRPDGSPYSSFGLIWLHFGHDMLRVLNIPEADIPSIHEGLDRDFVLGIDLMDNGALEPSAAGPILANLTLPAFLEMLKPDFDDPDPDADDRAFAVALGIARIVLEAALRRRAAKARAETLVHDAILATGTARVLELPRGMPFRAGVEKAGADHLLFVVHPRDKDWALTGIRLGDNTFEQRADLPLGWAGLTDAALEEASGVKGAKFCHNGRFIAVADSREAILAMAELAVSEHLAQA